MKSVQEHEEEPVVAEIVRKQSAVKLVLALLLTTIVVILGGCAAKPVGTAPAPVPKPVRKMDSDRILQEAIALYDQKEYKQAIVIFEAVAKNDPDDKQVREYLEKAHFIEGLHLFGKEEYLAARDEFKTALQYNPKCDQCEKNIQKSEDIYKEVHYEKGIAFFGKELLAEAIQEWELVSAIDPNYKDVNKILTKAKTLYGRLESIKLSKYQNILISERAKKIPCFPWPPPPASAELPEILSNWLLTRGEEPSHLSDVAKKLEKALRSAKYRRWSYISVPDGFALVTQMEQIKPDGTPSPEPARWSTNMPRVDKMNLLEFIKALADAQPGYYRVIVFIVTDQPWQRIGDKPTGEVAELWFAKGFNKLPEYIGRLTYGREHRTTALVYEFKKRTSNADAIFIDTSETRAMDHLKKAGICDPLSGLP